MPLSRSKCYQDSPGYKRTVYLWKCCTVDPYSSLSFVTRYNLKTKGQQAAYIANMAYEGGYLKYNHNLNTHSQGSKYSSFSKHILFPFYPTDFVLTLYLY